MPVRNNMLADNILPSGGFTPATFQGNTFTPQQVDMSLLARSLDKIEEREEKLANQKLALGEAFSKARELLPDNEETNQYITDNQNRIRDNINAMISIGDYAGAINSSRRLAGDFISSPEYNARVKEHKSRKEWIEQLDHSNVDNYIKEYYKDTYQDKNNFTRDKDGNITGTAGWEAPLPEQGQSANAIIQAAVKATADQRTDVGSSWTGEDGTGGSSASSREWLTADRISSTAKSLVNNDPRVKQAFIDQFNAGIHQINKLSKKITSLEEELSGTIDPTKRGEIQTKINALSGQVAGYKTSCYKNSAPLESADAYIDNLFSANNDEIKNAAYDYKHSRSGSDKYVKGNNGAGDGLVLTSNPTGNVDDLKSNASAREVNRGGEKMPAKTNRSGLSYVAPGNNWSSE